MSETADPDRAEATGRLLNWFTPGRFALLLAALIFASFPQVLLGLQTFVARDYGFFAYPLACFQHECFHRGELPFWDPYNNCGVPFLAQWNTMPLYPLSLIYLLLPLPWSLGFFCLLHLWFAGFGMYWLARRWTGNNFASAFAGVAFAFNGLTLNLLMWPSHMATWSWMPWVVLAVEIGWRQGREKIVLAALVGAMQMLAGGPEIIFFTWLILLSLWVQQLLPGTRCRASEANRTTGTLSPPLEPLNRPMPAKFSSAAGGRLLSPLSGGEGQGEGGDENIISASFPAHSNAPYSLRLALLRRFPLVILLVVGLTAAQLLPFLDLVAHSQRETGYADLRWSMPGHGWVNFLVPMAFGRTWTEGIFLQNGQYWTSSYYLGLGTLWLALLALVSVRHRRVWLLGALALCAVVCALGDNTPIYPALRRLIPQLSIITYPVKYLLVVAFAAPLLAAFALAFWTAAASGAARRFGQEEAIPDDATPSKTVSLGGRTATLPLSLIGLFLLVLLGVVLFWTQRFPLPTDNPHATLLNGLSRAFFLLLSGGILLLLIRPASSPLKRVLPLALIFVAWLDVFTHEPTQNPTVAPWILQPGLSRARLDLHPQPALGQSRAMVSPMAALEFINFSLGDSAKNFLVKRLGYCANCNLLDAVPKVDGFFSLTPRENDDVLSLFYTTTNADYPRLEDFLGVSQITAPDEIYRWRSRTNFLPLVTAGQKPVFLSDADTLRALTGPDFDARQIVLLPPCEKPFVTVAGQTKATIINPRFGTQSVQFQVKAAASSLVVVAQTWYHDWRADVDGKPALLLRANDAFQALEIPAGSHRVQLFYRDRAFAIGAIVSLLALLTCLICVLTSPRQQTSEG